MSLGPGTQVGPYEIVSPLGVGGMGEVYRARDTRLKRDVALKILPESFATDPERLARFQREAEVLASLNHRNIAAIHGFEEANRIKALVMELVEGETLADRIARGPIPIEEALPIARQIAEGLEAAHEKGIIHRDLKPANIKVRPDGTVKLLDFGLAKALEPTIAASPSTSQSPTITSPAMTGVGVLLGTATYMSPEQAKGRAADKRSDIWSFGCVLYEMLTCRRAFDAEDVSDTLALVLKGQPDWNALPVDVPVSIQTLIRACLEKDRLERVADMSAALFILKHQTHLAGSSTPAVLASTGSGPRLRRQMLLVLAASVIAAVAAAVGTWLLKPGTPGPVARFTINLPEGQQFTNTGMPLVALSPDGARLVYVANNRLYIRTFDQLEPVPLRGTEGVGVEAPRGPFLSPDGESIGFWQNGQLKKVSVTGGVPVTLCAVANSLQGTTWTDDGTILYGQGPAGIWRVSANGGTPENIVKVEDGQAAYGPQVLPGGRKILFTLARTSGSFWNDADIVVQSLDTGARQTIIRGGKDARYLPTGHVVYASRGTLFAARFDPESLTLINGAVPVVNDELWPDPAGLTPSAQFTVSRNGTLAYAPSQLVVPLDRTLVWVTRGGKEEPVPAPPRPYQYLRLSPDGTRVALDVFDVNNRDIWIWDLARRTLMRLTFDSASDRAPVWTPDSRRIIFSSDRAGVGKLFWQAADGTGNAHALTDRGGVQFPTSVSPDGTRLVLREGTPGGTSVDLMKLALGGNGSVEPLIRTAFRETNGEISPDGRWLAYQSEVSSRYEIYVRPFPNIDAGQWQISTDGGIEPLWARSGRELFYRSRDGAVMRVGVEAGAGWAATVPVQLFEGKSYLATDDAGRVQRTYDVSGDDQRFLMIKAIGQPQETSNPRIVVVLNWSEELKRLLPSN